jgi:hypothetical protein
MSGMQQHACSTATRTFLTQYLRRKVSHILSSYILRDTTYNLLIVQKRFEIVLCRNWSLSQCAAYVLWNLHMREVLYLTYTGNFYFWILLPGREIYFLDLLSCTQFLNYIVQSVAPTTKIMYWLVKYLSCIILYYKACLKSWQTIVVFPYLLPFFNPIFDRVCIFNIVFATTVR